MGCMSINEKGIAGQMIFIGEREVICRCKILIKMFGGSNYVW